MQYSLKIEIFFSKNNQIILPVINDNFVMIVYFDASFKV